MSYRVTASDPEITLVLSLFEKAVANFCKSNGITSQAQYDAGVAGITAGSALELAAVKAMLGSITVTP